MPAPTSRRGPTRAKAFKASLQHKADLAGGVAACLQGFREDAEFPVYTFNWDVSKIDGLLGGQIGCSKPNSAASLGKSFVILACAS